MAVQLVGPSLISLNTQADGAAFVAQKPLSPGALGWYNKGQVSGTMAAGLSAASVVYAFRYTGSNVGVVTRVRVTLGDLVGFTAGFFNFSMFAARTFTAMYSGGSGSAGTFTGNNAKLRTALATPSNFGSLIASTAALTTATVTLDTDPLTSLALSVVATAGQPPFPGDPDLFYKAPGEYPLVLAQNEGFVIQATVPATGTWQMGVDVAFGEVASF